MVSKSKSGKRPTISSANQQAEPMRLLIIIDTLIRGGRERRLIELLKGLRLRKDIITEVVVFSTTVEYEEVWELGIPIHIMERKVKKDPRIFYQFYKLANRFKPDLVHSWGSMSSIYALPAIKMLGAKFINCNIYDAPLGLNFRNSKYLRAHLTFPFADVVLSNSEAGLKAYDAPMKKSRCIYNGFDFNRITVLKDPEEVRRAMGIKTSKVVGMVGAFQDRKDYFTYIEAAQQILAQRQDITFLAIGNGKNLELCQAMVAPENKDNILFPGLLKQVESVINIFDIGVLTTNAKVHGEGISNAIVEYMVLGKPVVATDGGGTPEIVVDGQTGFLVPPQSVDDLVEKLQYLFDHPEEAEIMGSQGAERVRAQFSLDRMIAAYIDLYEEIFKN